MSTPKLLNVCQTPIGLGVHNLLTRMAVLQEEADRQHQRLEKEVPRAPLFPSTSDVGLDLLVKYSWMILDVHGFAASIIWGCPSKRLESHEKRHCGGLRQNE